MLKAGAQSFSRESDLSANIQARPCRYDRRQRTRRVLGCGDVGGLEWCIVGSDAEGDRELTATRFGMNS